MSIFCLDEYCDCLEYDYFYDTQELSEILKETLSPKVLLELKQLHKIINKRQLTILKLIGDNYIEEGVPNRLLDIYLKIFALESFIELFIKTH